MTTATKKKLTTWKQIAEYTWDHSWKRSKASRTVSRRLARVESFCGPSLPLSTMRHGWWWKELQNDILEKDEVCGATVNRAVSLASHALKFTYDLDLHSVKCPRFGRLNEGEARQSYFTKAQVDHLAFTAVDLWGRQDLADAMLFSAYTGVRQGELLMLTPSDVDFNLNVIWIGGRPNKQTKGKSRQVPISERIKPILEKRMGLPRLFGSDWRNKDQLYKCYLKVRNHVGFDDSYVWHSFRHSFATWCGSVDHPRNIMAVMGHRHIETTLRYCKASDEAIHSMVSKL